MCFDVLSTEESPSHWKLQYDQMDDGVISIEAIQEGKSMIRSMMEAADHIIEAATPVEQQQFRATIILACSKYQEAINLLTLHRIHDDEAQEHFKDSIVVFF